MDSAISMSGDRCKNPFFQHTKQFKIKSMSISIATLSTIQRAGAAIFAADVELQNAVKEYAERVTAALVSNPYGLGNDTLFENWKVVARLSQSMTAIEEELTKIYHLAADLEDQPLAVQVSALAAPTPSVEPDAGSQNDMTPTDVRVKPRKKPSRPGTRRTRSSARGLELGGNAAKLLRHFEKVLNSNEFTVISQTAIGREIGIPMGSMTAATQKLMESGRLMAGPAGSFKLVNLA